ncbi:MAG: hemolysin family protein [Bacteroidales bacterium]|nr:hemolysin family protein [Bacteroidales bacterium]
MEIAFISANRLKIELNKKQNSASSKIINLFINNPGQYISTMLVGNNIALVLYGIFFAKLAEPFIKQIIHTNDFIVLLVQTIFSTLLILVTAEFLPKTIFRQNSNFLLQKLAVPVLIFYIIFFPVAKITVRFSNIFISIITKNKSTGKNKNIVLKKVDLDNFLADNEESIDDKKETAGEVKIFKNALDFSDIKIRECMVPRNEIIAENITTEITALKKKFIETGFSKIFIYKDNIDNLIGYVHTLAMFKHSKTIKAAMTELTVVPETMPANKLLNKLLKEHKSVAVVVDEFGGTSGIVTLEDIIEEIFGEIEDEHDASVFIEQQINNNEFIFSARIEIDYLNDKYKLTLPESEEFETLAGYIFYLHEQIPRKNEIIETDQYTFEILEVGGPKIEKVRLIIK